MSFERLKIAGLALLCAALTLAARRTTANTSSRGAADQAVHPVSSVAPGAEPAWVIPVEIVETGEAPRIHQVRGGR